MPVLSGLRAMPFGRHDLKTVPDLALVGAAVALPWSTTATDVLIGIWIVSLIPSITSDAFRTALRPICILPVALFLVLLIAVAWSPAPLAQCAKSAGAFAKLLLVPMVVYYSRGSAVGHRVLIAFIGSCTLLQSLSWLSAIYPFITFRPNISYGVPVKNYIDQSQEFLCCATILSLIAMATYRDRPALSIGVLLLAFSFFANLLLINVSRTALVSLPGLLLILLLFRTRTRRALIVVGIFLVAVVGSWQMSANLRNKVRAATSEFAAYRANGEPNNVGARIEYWRRSIIFISQAPLIGNGTGSVQLLFERSAENQVGAAAEVVSNPHNEILDIGVQTGVIGMLLLLAMWGTHFGFFCRPGLSASIGLVIVVQNFLTSIFNSHILDHNPGLMYVVGVGLAAGSTLNLSDYTSYSHTLTNREQPPPTSASEQPSVERSL